MTTTTIEAVSVRDGDVICDRNGKVWRFDDRDEFRWTDFDGNGLRREVPPGPYTLLVAYPAIRGAAFTATPALNG